jgi:hypothetical protein
VITDQTLGYIASKLDERRTELVEFISLGSIKDFFEYQKLCGVIQGLDTAKQIITDLAKRLETEDDE